MINRVVLVGRLTRDPETRTTNTGKMVANFSIAVDRRFKRDGDAEADFFRVSCWEKSAEFVSNYLGKGRLVAVDGRLEQRKFTDKDGNNRESIEVVAETVQALDRPKDDDDAPNRQKATAGKSTAARNDDYDPFADD